MVSSARISRWGLSLDHGGCAANKHPSCSSWGTLEDGTLLPRTANPPERVFPHRPEGLHIGHRRFLPTVKATHGLGTRREFSAHHETARRWETQQMLVVGVKLLKMVWQQQESQNRQIIWQAKQPKLEKSLNFLKSRDHQESIAKGEKHAYRPVSSPPEPNGYPPHRPRQESICINFGDYKNRRHKCVQPVFPTTRTP